MNFAKQERFDKEVYQSLRNQYEYILLRMIEPDRPRNKVMEDVKILLEVFNNTSKTAEELTGKVRRLENVSKLYLHSQVAF